MRNVARLFFVGIACATFMSPTGSAAIERDDQAAHGAGKSQSCLSGRRPRPPYHAWFQPALVKQHPELYRHMNLVASGGDAALGKWLHARRIALLQWAYGPNSPWADGADYFWRQCQPNKPNSEFRYPGVAVDEWSNPNKPQSEEWAAGGLRKARREDPRLFLAVWVTHPTPTFVSLMQDKTISLAIIEGYTFVPAEIDQPGMTVGWEGIRERCEILKKADVLDRTIACFGHVTGKPNKSGKRMTCEELRRLVSETKRLYPAMPGVAFYQSWDDDTEESHAVVQCADALSQEFYPDHSRSGEVLGSSGAGARAPALQKEGHNP